MIGGVYGVGDLAFFFCRCCKALLEELDFQFCPHCKTRLWFRR